MDKYHLGLDECVHSSNNNMQAVLRNDVEAEHCTLLWLRESEVCCSVNVHKNNLFTRFGSVGFPVKQSCMGSSYLVHFMLVAAFFMPHLGFSHLCV